MRKRSGLPYSETDLDRNGQTKTEWRGFGNHRDLFIEFRNSKCISFISPFFSFPYHFFRHWTPFPLYHCNPAPIFHSMTNVWNRQGSEEVGKARQARRAISRQYLGACNGLLNPISPLFGSRCAWAPLYIRDLVCPFAGLSDCYACLYRYITLQRLVLASIVSSLQTTK